MMKSPKSDVNFFRFAVIYSKSAGSCSYDLLFIPNSWYSCQRKGHPLLTYSLTHRIAMNKFGF